MTIALGKVADSFFSEPNVFSCLYDLQDEGYSIKWVAFSIIGEGATETGGNVAPLALRRGMNLIVLNVKYSEQKIFFRERMKILVGFKLEFTVFSL